MSEQNLFDCTRWSAEAQEVLLVYSSPHQLAVDWLLGRLPEGAKVAVRIGVTEPNLRIMIEEIDQPEAAADFRDLLDVAQCLATPPVEEPELGKWADSCRADPPAEFFAGLVGLLDRHGLEIREGMQEEAAHLWRSLIGTAPARDFFRLRDRLERLRKTSSSAYSVVEQCALRDYPELVKPANGEGYLFFVSLREFVLRRLRAWCRSHCRPARPGGSLHARLARWTAEDGNAVMDLLGCGVAIEKKAQRRKEEEVNSDAEGGQRAPILFVSENAEASETLRRIANKARTPVSNQIRRYDGPEDIVEAHILAAARPCVIVVPGRNDTAADAVNRLQHLLKQPRIILALGEDDPAQAWSLLCRGAFDVFWQKGRSANHLRQTIGQAANGASRPPYFPIFTDTGAYDPKPGARRWATVYPEEVSSETNERDYRVLRRLPGLFGLSVEADEFQEVPSRLIPSDPDATDLAFALLSDEPRSEATRREFLVSMKLLEDHSKRVLYLQRRSASQLAHPLGEPRPWRRVLRYRSAIELLLRLYFGFGGIVPERDRSMEVCEHDAPQQTGK